MKISAFCFDQENQQFIVGLSDGRLMQVQGQQGQPVHSLQQLRLSSQQQFARLYRCLVFIRYEGITERAGRQRGQALAVVVQGVQQQTGQRLFGY